MKLHRQAHAVYKTQYHIVWVTRYRRKILVGGIAQYFKQAIREVREFHPLIRRYDTPRTPFERVCQCQQADPRKLAMLKHTLKSTNPFELSSRIDRQPEQIYKLANRAEGTPREPVPSKYTNSSPWRNWTYSLQGRT